MAETKRIAIEPSLLNQVDIMVPMECKSRTDCVIETMKNLVIERKKLEIYEKLREGYKEMSQINLALAEMGLEQDICELVIYEVRLKRRGML